MVNNHELFISVDVETAGPIPGEYSLLQIGACVVDNDKEAFSCLLKPINRNSIPAALKVTGLKLEALERDGMDPIAAMRQFKQWILHVVHDNRDPVFVGLNAAFDWSFVNYYFYRYLGDNPFGIAALDLKSLYMGAMGCSWEKTGARQMSKHLHANKVGDHDALHDAQFQAELFRLIRATSELGQQRRQ